MVIGAIILSEERRHRWGGLPVGPEDVRQTSELAVWVARWTYREGLGVELVEWIRMQLRWHHWALLRSLGARGNRARGKMARMRRVSETTEDVDDGVLRLRSVRGMDAEESLELDVAAASKELLKSARPRERAAISMRMLGMSLTETANVLGVNRERARQLEARGLRRMHAAAVKMGYVPPSSHPISFASV